MARDTEPTDLEPALDTEDGKPAAVLITPQEFDSLQQRERVIEAIEEGLTDVAAGRVIDDENLDDEFARPSDMDEASLKADQ